MKKAAKRADMTQRDLLGATKEIEKISKKPLPPPPLLRERERRKAKLLEREGHKMKWLKSLSGGILVGYLLLLIFSQAGNPIYADQAYDDELPVNTTWIGEPKNGGDEITLHIKKGLNGHTKFTLDGRTYYWESGSKRYECHGTKYWVSINRSLGKYDANLPSGGGGGTISQVPPPIGG